MVRLSLRRARTDLLGARMRPMALAACAMRMKAFKREVMSGWRRCVSSWMRMLVVLGGRSVRELRKVVQAKSKRREERPQPWRTPLTAGKVARRFLR
jgi:hypothetical protein